jgi:hypothetical protein
MISNVEKVVDFLQRNNLEYWKVRVKDADNYNVFESDDEKPFEINVKRFRDVMDISTGNRYFLYAAPKKGTARGNFYEEFQNLQNNLQSASMQQIASVTGITDDEVQKRIEAAISGFKTQMEIENLRKENSDLKKELNATNTTQNRILSKIEPYIGTLISAILPKFLGTKEIAIAGLLENEEPNINDNENSETMEQKLLNALQKWQDADVDYIKIIEKCAQMATENDPMYDMAKKILIK